MNERDAQIIREFCWAVARAQDDGNGFFPLESDYADMVKRALFGSHPRPAA